MEDVFSRKLRRRDLIFTYKQDISLLTSVSLSEPSLGTYDHLSLDLKVIEEGEVFYIEGNIIPITTFKDLVSTYYRLDFDLNTGMLTETVKRPSEDFIVKEASLNQKVPYNTQSLYNLYAIIDDSKEAFTLGNITSYLVLRLSLSHSKFDSKEVQLNLLANILQNSFNNYNGVLITKYDLDRVVDWPNVASQTTVNYDKSSGLTLETLMKPYDVADGYPLYFVLTFDFNKQTFSYSMNLITEIEPQVVFATLETQSFSFTESKDFTKLGVKHLLHEVDKRGLASSGVLHKLFNVISMNFWN